MSAPAPRRWPWLLAALTAAAFAPALGGGFLLDDPNTVVHNPALTSWRWLLAFWDAAALTADANQQAMMYRPLTAWALALNHLAAGKNAWGYHLVSILLHAANSGLLLLLLTRLLGDKERWAALGGAVLFALHPANAETVAYISGGRGTLLCQLFVLLSLLAYGGKRPKWAWAGFAAALLAKESGALLLALLPAYDRVYRPRESAAARRERWLGLALIFVGYLLQRWLVLGAVAQRGPWGGDWNLHAQLAAHGNFEHLKILLAPYALRACYSYPVGGALFGGAVAKGAVLAGLGAAALWALRRRPKMGFALLWICAGLIPVSNIVPIEALAADRFVYPALPGLCLLWAEVLRLWPRERRRLAVGLLVLAAGANLWRDLPRFKGQLELDAMAYAAAPADPCTGHNLAVHAYNAELYGDALKLLERPLRADAPPHVRASALVIGGMSHHYQGDDARARAMLAESLTLSERPWVRSLLGRLTAKGVSAPYRE